MPDENISKKRTVILGIIGGIGCGKSAVSSAFEDHGAVILNADHFGHAALEDPNIQNKLAQRWGNKIFRSVDNAFLSNRSSLKTIDRTVIAAIVFSETPASQTELRFLNNLIHPVIHREIKQKISELTQKGTPLVILDAPLLLETGMDDLCDRILFVKATQKNRWERVKKRGWRRKDFLLREKNQLSTQEKQKKADLVLDNNESCEKMKEQVSSLVLELLNEK